MVGTADAQRARFFALLYSPEPQRRLLEAVLGIEREIFSSLREGVDHQVSHARLQWWREECDRSAKGKALHPLTRKITELIGTSVAGADPAASAVGDRVSAAHSTSSPVGNRSACLASLSGFVANVQWDLACATFETRKELALYCERWAAAIVTPVFATANLDTSQLDRLYSIGACVRELELLADVVREAHRGRLRLPLDELAQAAVDPQALSRPPLVEPLAALLRHRHGQLARELGETVRESAASRVASLRGWLVWAKLTLATSARACRALPNSYRPSRWDMVVDAARAWNSARGLGYGRR